MRQSPCKWLSRDRDGRPSCEHGTAIKQGKWWSCRLRKLEADRRYAATEKGRAFRQAHQQKPETKLSKQFHELTRVRIR